MFQLQHPSPSGREFTDRDSRELDIDASSSSSRRPAENTRTAVTQHRDKSSGGSTGSTKVQQVMLWPLQNNGVNNDLTGRIPTSVPGRTKTAVVMLQTANLETVTILQN